KICFRITYTENDLLASLFVQPATGAVADVFADRAQRLYGIRNFRFGFRSTEQVVFHHGNGFGFWHRLGSRFIRHSGTVVTVKVVDPQFVVKANALLESTAELRAKRHEGKLSVSRRAAVGSLGKCRATRHPRTRERFSAFGNGNRLPQANHLIEHALG